jgi:dTDP-4-dehydrorhamnose 3,5-epimerase
VSKHEKLISGVSLWRPNRPFTDQRGYFYEKYNRDFLALKNISFVQENISMSWKGTIRGLHWQSDPKSQGKLVTCIVGEIFDVAVDIRKGSKTFGQYCSQILKGGENNSLWVPRGFAHGFQALSNECIISYSVTNDFSSECSKTINPDCPTIGIEWPLEDKILSKNDADAKVLSELLDEKIFFN